MRIRESIDALVAAFNRGSLDVPANFLTSRTTFTLNGRSYESILAGAGLKPCATEDLGGSPDDPLIRLLARGAAGYRTVAKALQYALQGPRVVLESLTEPDDSGVRTAAFRVEGRLRDADEPFLAGATCRLGYAQDELTSVDVVCAEDDLARIAASRRA